MIKLVIFDVDGLMLDTERPYLEAVKVTCQKYGYNIPDEINNAAIGANSKATREMICAYMGPDFDYDVFYDHLLQETDLYFNTHPIQKKKGLDELLTYLKKRGVTMAVATSTGSQKNKENLTNAGIYDYFDHMVTGEMVSRSKPNPDIYLKVLDHYDFKPSEVCVFEDSKNGLLSATAAGLKVILVPDLSPLSKEDLQRAYCVLDDLSQGIDVIEKM